MLINRSTPLRMFAISLLALFPFVSLNAAQYKDIGDFDKPMRFSMANSGGNSIGCCWISAIGSITEKTPAQFEKFIEDNQDKGIPSRIVLHSPGGELIAGMRLGRAFREHGIFTRVGRTYIEVSGNFTYGSVKSGECLSACAYAFFGGIDRALVGSEFVGNENSRIGLHQFYAPQSLRKVKGVNPEKLAMSAAQLLTGIIVGYAIEMGVDGRVVALASATPSDQISYLSKAELEQLNVVTQSGFGKIELAPHGNGLVAYTRQTDIARVIEQITAYCRLSDRSQYLMLTTDDPLWNRPEADSSRAWAPRNLDRSEGLDLTIDGEQLSLGYANLEYATSNGKRLYKIRLPDRIAGKVVKAQAVAINLNFPQAAGFHYGEFSLDEVDRKAIKLAFTHCP